MPTAPGPSAGRPNATRRASSRRWCRPASTAAVTHYLKAVIALKSAADGKAVVAEMKELPTDDPLFGKGTVRADGRKIHPAYLFEVKAPGDSKGPWDYYTLVSRSPRTRPSARSPSRPARW